MHWSNEFNGISNSSSLGMADARGLGTVGEGGAGIEEEGGSNGPVGPSQLLIVFCLPLPGRTQGL